MITILDYQSPKIYSKNSTPHIQILPRKETMWHFLLILDIFRIFIEMPFFRKSTHVVYKRYSAHSKKNSHTFFHISVNYCSYEQW